MKTDTQVKKVPLNAPPPAEDESFEDWKDRTTKRGPDYVCPRCGKPSSVCNC